MLNPKRLRWVFVAIAFVAFLFAFFLPSLKPFLVIYPAMAIAALLDLKVRRDQVAVVRQAIIDNRQTWEPKE